jgi:hypothetical protein
MKSAASLSTERGAAPAAPFTPGTLGEFFAAPCLRCGGEMERRSLSLYVGGRGYVCFWRCGECEALREVNWSEVIGHFQRTAGVAEPRVEYVLESCPEPYYRPKPPHEALEELIRTTPGGWAVSVLWWSPPKLEALVLSVFGKNRYFFGEVLPE